jgi:DNA helicase II / ATP-dependent DNA helicase PcrA
MSFNPDQQEVIDTHNGAICLQAGPGSGKTATLIGRHKAIVDSGVRPEEILSLTFTKSAAEEMGRRAGNRGLFKTFHSFGYDVISREKGRPPMEPELRHRLLIKLIRKYRLDYKELTAYISAKRHHNVSPEQAISEDPYGKPQAYREYEKERAAGGWIDFDSMIRDAVDLLENPSIRANHQYRYVMADECQDTDDLQFRLLQLITERHGNILCVGDPGQSIYMFRGAQPENLTNFTRWFPKGRYLYLGQNYRSTQRIVTFVRENYPINTPLQDKLLPARNTEGSCVEYRLFHTEADEAESAVVSAQEDPLNSIILARTNRGLALAENLCLEHNIRYHLLGKSGFWKQSEIIKTVDKLKEYGHIKPEIAFNIVMPDLERHYQAEDATPEDNFALENIRTLRDISKKFADTKTFCVFANRAAHARQTTKGITLSTCHQAKGGEWGSVFLTGARAGMMPHDKGVFEEERRIAFVAISRAKDRLRISWTGQPSSFWRRYLPEPVMDELREKATQVERIEKQLNLLS